MQAAGSAGGAAAAASPVKPMARPKRQLADDAAEQGVPKVRLMNSDGLREVVTGLHDKVAMLTAQARLDRAAWTAVEQAFDTHATRIEELGHRDLQWNGDFALSFDGIRKTVQDLDAKHDKQMGQVMVDFTGVVRKAELDLMVVIQNADEKFQAVTRELHERVTETKVAFQVVEQTLGALGARMDRMDECVARGLRHDPQSGLFVGEATAVHSMSPNRNGAAAAPTVTASPGASQDRQQ